MIFAWGMCGNGCKMNITVIIMVPLIMEVAGVQETVQKTLVIRPTTLAIVPRVLFVAVLGAAVRRTCVLRSAPPAARRISTTASVLVFPESTNAVL